MLTVKQHIDCPNLTESCAQERNRRLCRLLLLPLLTLSLLLPACYSEGFVLNELTPYTVYGRKLTPIGSVEIEQGTLLQLQDSALAAVRIWRETQIEVEFNVTLTSGEFTDIHMRLVPMEFDIGPSIRLRYGIDGVDMMHQGKILAATDRVRAVVGMEERIRILSDGDRLRVKIGCEIIYDGNIRMPATEFLVMQTPPNASAEFKNFSWVDAVPGISTQTLPTIIVE